MSRHITRIVDPLGRITDLRYDAQKNVDRITRYKGPGPTEKPVIHQFTYDLTPGHFNLLTQYKDPLDSAEPGQHVWTYGLDATGKNVVSITNPLNKTWTIQRLATGQPQWIEQPAVAPDPPSRTTFTYDPATGLLASVQDHLGNTTSYTYDLLGRRITMTEPRGFTTRTTYDRLDRLIAAANPLGQAVRFQYDPNSNLTKVIDPRGGEIRYTYTNMDLLETRIDQLGRTETYSYDAQGGGTLTSFRDRKNQLTTWAPYDDLNRPTTMTFQDGSTLTYNYDAANRLFRLDDSVSGSITRTFDALDRLTREQTPQGVIDYVPDDADRRTTMTVAGQPDVTYLWDDANRLQTITRDTLVASYLYDDANRRTSLQLPNGVTIASAYDEADRLTGLTYTGPSGPLGDLSYAYDAASNRVVTAGSWARTLLPDPVSGGTYDDANRQTALGGKTMTYDFNGNLQTLAEGGNTTTYTWDLRDRLTALSGPGLAASFAYDATGRRTSKTTAGFSTTFLYDEQDIIKEIAGGNTVNYLRGRGIGER